MAGESKLQIRRIRILNTTPYSVLYKYHLLLIIISSGAEQSTGRSGQLRLPLGGAGKIQRQGTE
jgi:hypothetical protein